MADTKGKSKGRDFTVEDTDTSAYHGVSHEYATYGADTEKPLASSEDRKLYEKLAQKRDTAKASNPGTRYKGNKNKDSAKATTTAPQVTPPPPPPAGAGGTKEGNAAKGGSSS